MGNAHLLHPINQIPLVVRLAIFKVNIWIHALYLHHHLLHGFGSIDSYLSSAQQIQVRSIDNHYSHRFLAFSPHRLIASSPHRLFASSTSVNRQQELIIVVRALHICLQFLHGLYTTHISQLLAYLPHTAQYIRWQEQVVSAS